MKSRLVLLSEMQIGTKKEAIICSRAKLCFNIPSVQTEMEILSFVFQKEATAP